jgi:hypothetical protein
MMDAPFLAHVVRHNRLLWRRILRFNCFLAADVHPARLADEVDRGVWQRLCARPRAEAALSAWIAERFGLDARGYWDFAEPRWRLALLSGVQWARTARLLGVAALQPQLAKLLDGAQVRQARSSLGADDYAFALKRAPLLVRRLPPEAAAPPLADDVAAQADDWGWRLLRGCLTGAAPSLLERLALKLPPDRELGVGVPLSESGCTTLFAQVRRLVVSEAAPEDAVCFA